MGTRILVAGASSDIGMAFVPGLLELPIQLGLHGYQSLGRVETLVKARERAATIKFFSCSLDTGKAAIELVRDYCAWAGGIDVLVQLTGNVASPVSWETLSPEAWEKDMAVNLTAPFFLARESMKHMTDGGRVVLMSNAATQRGGGGNTMAYGVAKAGIDRVVKSLAKFGAARHILVNAVSPGFIETRFHTEKAKRSPQELVERKAMIPVGYAGKPEDVVEVIDYLISSNNRYMTGQCLRIDGGDFI